MIAIYRYKNRWDDQERFNVAIDLDIIPKLSDGVDWILDHHFAKNDICRSDYELINVDFEVFKKKKKEKKNEHTGKD